MKRAVRIVRCGDFWAVKYAKRSKSQRYWAASFYAPDHTLEQVEQWVKNNSKLTLESQ